MRADIRGRATRDLQECGMSRASLDVSILFRIASAFKREFCRACLLDRSRNIRLHPECEYATDGIKDGVVGDAILEAPGCAGYDGHAGRNLAGRE